MEGSCRQSWHMKGSPPDAGAGRMSLARGALAEIMPPGKVKVTVPDSFKPWVPNQAMGKPLSGNTECLLIYGSLRGA